MSSLSDRELCRQREIINAVDDKLLESFSERATVALCLAEHKQKCGLPIYDPRREAEVVQRMAGRNPGPLSDSTVQTLFKEVITATRDAMEKRTHHDMQAMRSSRPDDTVLEVNGQSIGGRHPMALVAGPCAVESEEQLEAIAQRLEEKGVKIMRGGAFKPRTSPYSFQGLGLDGVKLLHRVAQRHNLAVITEVTEVEQVEPVAEYADVLQIGARNMYNYPLLKAVGKCQRPVVLKRHFGATLDELVNSAEYILYHGNAEVILCERGIRTFEPWTRYTLDIAAVPVLHKCTHLPVMVDVSHAAGRVDIIPSLCVAVKAVGADALMIEVHNDPANALSDGFQQLNLDEFSVLCEMLQTVKS